LNVLMPCDAICRDTAWRCCQHPILDFQSHKPK
jgi:hypothetical protein